MLTVDLERCDAYAEPERHRILLAEYTDLNNKFIRDGGLEFRGRCRSILGKLGFDAEAIDKRVDFLSGGTRDLTYVALRCALIDMLYTEKPPICFDESFAHQDNARAKSMMKAIKALSAYGQQSFIFTCREREAGLAKDVSATSEVFKLSTLEEEII